MDAAREARWQAAWASAGLARAHRDPERDKFFAIVAYPGSSGFLHVGHLRGLAYADVLHRYHRMNGRAVFFPTGTHVTGLPAVTFAQKVKQREPILLRQLEEEGVPRSEWNRLEEPEEAGRFLGQRYLAAFRSFGLLIDERAYVTTIDDDYRAFIRWQFHRLDRAGALAQAPHYAAVCPVCGPVSVDPSETDLSRGGTAEWILYHMVPFALPDGRMLLAATLRPETLFGATNVWLPPGGKLVTWHLGDHRFLVGPSGGRRLLEQHGGHLGTEVDVKELVGHSARVPITGRNVPLIESPLVDPTVGTGVVMSVPAHAPADWVAVHELHEHHRQRLPPIEAILDVEEGALNASERELLAGGGVPAERASRALKVRGLADTEALQAATERLYRVELLRGRMKPAFLDGLPVGEARRRIVADLAAGGTAPDLREFSEPVVCRNGHEVVIERVPDQWFLRYGDPAWKAKDRQLLARLEVRPEEYKRELPGVIEWLGDRPCTRRGRWLGTPFPNDESWVIEPIADSTLYPAYFPVRPFVASGEVATSALTEAFFDRVLLGRGAGEPSLPQELQDRIRAEFEYWYPLDLNIAGKEHKRVHFPVFLATHALLLPPALHPKGLFVHGWLTGPGGSKISKKEIGGKGGLVPPLREAFERWGADALRLYYAISASPAQDVEWDAGAADSASQRLEELGRLAAGGLVAGPGGPPELERWLDTRVHELLERIARAIEECRIRDAAEAVYAEFPSVLRRYLARGGVEGDTLRRATRAWIATMSPFTPHVAEEVGDGHFDRLVAASPFPRADDFPAHPGALSSERVIELLEEDLRAVLRPGPGREDLPDEVVVFVAAPWKRLVEAWLREEARPGDAPPGIKEVMERAKGHPELAAYRGELARYVGRVAPTLRTETAPPAEATDDLAILRSASGYFTRRFRFRSFAVVPEDEGEPLDPMGRRERARPGRPAFYLFGRGGATEGGR